MDQVGVEYFDETYIKIKCDPGIAQEISDYFTFFVPGYKFMPAYRNKVWDGKVRLFNTLNCLLYAGLRSYIEEFCRDREYECVHLSKFSSKSFTPEQVKEFAALLKTTYIPTDYQQDAVATGIRDSRRLFLSPTASGKSFMIYLITRLLNQKTLIVVPTIGLVEQMQKDFVEYGLPEGMTHGIQSGSAKDSARSIIVSTWQSIYKMPAAWFNQFGMIIVDEAHGAVAKSIQGVMNKATQVKYRFGFTGTLDGTKTHRLVLEGLFGPVYKVTTTKKLMTDGHLAQFKVRSIVLQYPDDIKKMLKKASYQDEISWIVTNEKRNVFIKNLALSLKGNTIILFNFVSKHGEPLYKLIKDAAGNRSVYFVAGKTEAEDREYVRQIMEKEEDAIVVASLGTFSTGINIKKLHNLIFASPSKSRIRVLQSIGRVLRKLGAKWATLYDIADDLSWKSHQNHTLKHFVERVKIYAEEQFEYTISRIRLY